MIHHHDVLIIGGGLTGLRAALRISDPGLDGAVVSKVHPLRSHSVAAQGGMNASLGNLEGEGGTKDNWKSHAYDTIKGSDYLADQDVVERMCREAPTAVIELEHMGMVWSRLENGKIAQRPFGGAGFPRTCYAADRTGHNVLHTLYEHVVSRKSSVYEEFFVTSLINEDGRCVGPVTLAKLYRFYIDPREAGTPRLKTADIPTGCWACEFFENCSRVCPKGVPPKDCNRKSRSATKKRKKEGPISQ